MFRAAEFERHKPCHPLGAKIHAHQENAVGQTPSMNIEHGVRSAPRCRTFTEAPTVRKSLTVATGYQLSYP